MTRRSELWSRREVERHRKPKRKRKVKPTSKKSKAKLKRKPKKPPKLPGSWRNRKRPRGYTARKIVKSIRGKRRKEELLTAISLAKKDDMDETSFINFVQSLNFTGKEAYTFWFSPP